MWTVFIRIIAGQNYAIPSIRPDPTMTPYDTAAEVNLERTDRHAGMGKIAGDLATVVEQGRLSASRMNEELGALGVQLRQQHLDVGERIASLQAGIGNQFDAMAAAIAASTSHTSRVSDHLTRRQHTLLIETVQKELALQLLPLQARTRAMTALCCISVCLSIALLAIMLLR